VASIKPVSSVCLPNKEKIRGNKKKTFLVFFSTQSQQVVMEYQLSGPILDIPV
jgi:hypothetical protein